MDQITDKTIHSELIFFVNGKKVIEKNPDPEWTLLFYLRKKLNLTGSKQGCGEGGCGACTVMISKYDRERDQVVHISVNACLMPVCSVHGLAVTTVEGIGSTKSRIHPVQERIAKAHGSQCGFCTPGMVMSMYTLIRNNDEIRFEDIEKTLQGNLCRCTGYRPIIEGFKTFIGGMEINSLSIDKESRICQLGNSCCKNLQSEVITEHTKLFDSKTFIPLDPSQEPIFPPELKLDPKLDEQFLKFKLSSRSVTWYRPTTLNELMALKYKYPNAKLVAGNTEVGVEVKFKKLTYSNLIDTRLIKELTVYSVNEDYLSVGASMPLSTVQMLLQSRIKGTAPHKVKVFKVLDQMLHWFAGNQIRNVASMGGNIVTASPISDLNPILMCCGANLNVKSIRNGWRKIPIDEFFFAAYRKTVLLDDDIIISIELPFSSQYQYCNAYKQAKRREDDISIVTGAFNVEFFPESNTINMFRICFGGIGPTVFSAAKTANAMIGLSWNEKIIDIALMQLTNEIILDDSAPGGMVDYRKSLCLSMFFKFFSEVYKKITNISNGFKFETCDDKLDTAGTKMPKSSQYFDIVSGKRKETDSLGKPISHLSSIKQATGEALYCDDIPTVVDELFLALVYSSKAKAELISIDATEALSLKGVKHFFSAQDLNEQNTKGLTGEEIFTSKHITSVGNILGAIIAEDENTARRAVNLVNVSYKDIDSPIVTLEDAIAMKSFYPDSPLTIEKGDTKKAFERCQHVIHGHCRSGAQEHFYLETQSCLAIPKEDELEIWISSQHPSEAAALIADVLGIQNNKVFVKVKRIGGGFGGKECRSAMLYLPVAIAAYKINKPVRGILDRDEDMQTTGQRHPYLIKYKVGFDGDGTISAAEFDLYSNAGCSLDLSSAVNERAVFAVDNCYRIPNVRVSGYVCKTNLPSNTAFRGFGGPQAMLATETMIRDIAGHLGKTHEEIVQKNLYKEGDLTHFNQPLLRCTIDRCWKECIEISNYRQKKKDIETFNSKNRWKKRGISIATTKFGISFGLDFMMQAGTLVHIYKDGSVLISIGGIEMGQGLFTKMAQVASRILELDISMIHISETATDKVPNASPTAGSASSDLYGMAVVDACRKLIKRLEPYKNQNQNASWKEWVLDAYNDRVSLSATGFYASPKITYDWKTNSGNMYEYFTFGVACSEVIVDCLTGDHRVLRTDIVMDLGESLNPAIDIGQVEGAFMQGYGLFTMEEMIYSPTGVVYSKGPGMYKIPGFGDIPREFNVSLLKDAPNPRAVYSSKAVGEPPLFLASSVFFAIKEAVSDARRDAGFDPRFHLDAPATCARIRMACEDHITTMVKAAKEDKPHTPWNVMA